MPTAHEILREGLRDNLDEVTRWHRSILLRASAVALLVVATGLIPKKIPALDIELSQSEGSWFLVLLAGVVLYFLLAFAVYAWSDWVSYRDRLSEAESDEAAELFKTFSRPVAARLLFDFAFPALFGTLAVVLSLVQIIIRL